MKHKEFFNKVSNKQVQWNKRTSRNGNIAMDLVNFFVRFGAKVNLHSPNIPTKYPDKEREAYQATRDKSDDSLVVTVKDNTKS